MSGVYADNNATTPVAPEVVESMLPWFQQGYGNPSSVHRLGREAAQSMQQARMQVAALIGCQPDEIVFTSGGTESDNLAIRGVLEANPSKRHWVTTSVEHSAVLNLCPVLKRLGFESTLLEVDRQGRLDLHQLRDAIRPDTAIVSVMWANNETGVLYPIQEIGEIVHECGALFHCDAVQAAGKVQLEVDSLPVDLLSISAHKLHGPKGVGALYLKRGKRFRAQVIGGDQEQGRRAGTENVPGIVGLGRACELALRCMAEDHQRIGGLRDRLEQQLREQIEGVVIHGEGVPRLDNTLSLSIEGVAGEAVLMELDEAGIYISSGSACSSHSIQPSHVLLAMGVEEQLARGALRISLGRYNTESDIDRIVDVLPGIANRLRERSLR